MTFEFEVSYSNAEAINLLDCELYNIDSLKIDKLEQSGFDGLDILFYFITTGTAFSLIKSISKVIIKTIERNDVKSFKCNNIEFKGYSEKEVEDMLDKISQLPADHLKKK